MPRKKIIGVGTPLIGLSRAMAPRVSWLNARLETTSIRARLTACACRPASGRTVVKAVKTR